MMAAAKGPTEANGAPNNGHVNWAFKQEAADEDSVTLPSLEGDVEQGRVRGSDTHSIILDISTTSFVDTVTVKTLKNVGASPSSAATVTFDE